MSEHAATVADKAIAAERRKKRLLSAVAPVTAIVLADMLLSALAFLISYKIHNQTPVFEWKRKFFYPVGIWDTFKPYLTLLLFVPFVKCYTLRRYGLYKLRGEFSFSGDFIKIFKACTLASLLMVLIAFLFRQGIAIQEDRLVFLDFTYSRMVFVYDWLFSIVMLYAAHATVRVIQIIYRGAERNLIPTVVVGCGEMAAVCISEISEKRRLGY
jgi:FlaA1/EpsC-like NDP-sugar epimerase